MIICENEIHEGKKVKLELYRKNANGRLFICNECGTLYFECNRYLFRLREESFLISNIDSPNPENSIRCDCGHMACRASDINDRVTPKRAWFFCPGCDEINLKDI